MNSPVRAVHPADGLVDLAAVTLVRIDLAAGRHCNLDVADLIAQGWLTFEQSRKRFETAGDALRVVEPVDAEHDPASAYFLAERVDSGADARVVGHRRKAGRVDAHRKRTNRYVTVPDANAVYVCLDAVDMQQRGHEVAEVAEGVKTDQVGAKQTLQNLAPPRQHPEDLGRGKGDVQ